MNCCFIKSKVQVVNNLFRGVRLKDFPIKENEKMKTYEKGGTICWKMAFL